MRPREARLVLNQIATWQAEGLISDEQATTLSERYRAIAETPEAPRTHPGVLVLQALGGIVLGAAVIAFTVFLELTEPAMGWVFTVLGTALLAVGLYMANEGKELGDTAAVAGLVPLTFVAALADENAVFFAVPILAPLVASGLRIDGLYVPPLSAIAFATASGISFAIVGWDLVSWLGLLILAAVASVIPAGLRAKGAWHAATTVLVVAVAIASAVAYFDLRLDWGEGGAELFVALFMGAALAAGVVLRHRGLILGAAIALAVDAIVFAFDVGGFVGGTLTLLIVAGALIGFATTYGKKIMG